MAVASYSGAPVERVPPVASRRRNGALVGAAWALAGLGLVALAVLEHERSKAEQGHGSMLCGTFFTCADALIKEHKGVFGDRKVAVKVPPKHMLIGIDTPVDPQEETGSQVPHPPPNDSQNFFSFGGEARDTIEQPSSIGRFEEPGDVHGDVPPPAQPLNESDIWNLWGLTSLAPDEDQPFWTKSRNLKPGDVQGDYPPLRHRYGLFNMDGLLRDDDYDVMANEDERSACCVCIPGAPGFDDRENHNIFENFTWHLEAPRWNHSEWQAPWDPSEVEEGDERNITNATTHGSDLLSDIEHDLETAFSFLLGNGNVRGGSKEEGEASNEGGHPKEGNEGEHPAPAGDTTEANHAPEGKKPVEAPPAQEGGNSSSGKVDWAHKNAPVDPVDGIPVVEAIPIESATPMGMSPPMPAGGKPARRLLSAPTTRTVKRAMRHPRMTSLAAILRLAETPAGKQTFILVSIPVGARAGDLLKAKGPTGAEFAFEVPRGVPRDRIIKVEIPAGPTPVLVAPVRAPAAAPKLSIQGNVASIKRAWAALSPRAGSARIHSLAAENVTEPVNGTAPEAGANETDVGVNATETGGDETAAGAVKEPWHFPEFEEYTPEGVHIGYGVGLSPPRASNMEACCMCPLFDPATGNILTWTHDPAVHPTRDAESYKYFMEMVEARHKMIETELGVKIYPANFLDAAPEDVHGEAHAGGEPAPAEGGENATATEGAEAPQASGGGVVEGGNATDKGGNNASMATRSTRIQHLKIIQAKMSSARAPRARVVTHTAEPSETVTMSAPAVRHVVQPAAAKPLEAPAKVLAQAVAPRLAPVVAEHISPVAVTAVSASPVAVNAAAAPNEGVVAQAVATPFIKAPNEGVVAQAVATPFIKAPIQAAAAVPEQPVASPIEVKPAAASQEPVVPQVAAPVVALPPDASDAAPVQAVAAPKQPVVAQAVATPVVAQPPVEVKAATAPKEPVVAQAVATPVVAQPPVEVKAATAPKEPVVAQAVATAVSQQAAAQGAVGGGAIDAALPTAVDAAPPKFPGEPSMPAMAPLQVPKA